MLAFHDWLLLASLCTLGAMTPGISLAVITRHTLLGGHRAGMAAAVTHGLGVGVWAFATVAGMAVLFHRYPNLNLVFSVVGAFFLLWMAWRSWQAGQRPLPPPPDAQPNQAMHGAARDGAMVALLNPKVALFYLALFSQFLRADLPAAGQAQIVATASLIDGGWYVLVAILLGRSRLLPWLREHHHWVERVTALLLLTVAISVLVRVLT